MEPSPILQAASDVFLNPTTLIVIFLSAGFGLFIGSIPGLTATMAVALLVPFTYFLDPVSALAAVVTLEACAIFAGDIPNTLVRIPGTPSSAAYTDDAYALTRQGRHEQALGVSLFFSVMGGLFGAVVLMTAAPSLAKVAFHFTSYEYFWLTILGLTCAAVVARGSVLKGAFALLLGLAFSMVGLSDVHDAPRFTFGIDPLIDGIHFIPAMIGLFGISEVFRNLLRGVEGSFAFANDKDESKAPASAKFTGILAAFIKAFGGLGSGVQRVFGPAIPLFWRRKWHALRSSLIGTMIGILPGAGADIGAWVSFAVSKRFSDKPEEYGKGSIEGIGDATASNNAALGGAWVPALVFGIPGDSITAIVIGVLLMKNIKPGPTIFEDQPALLYSIYLTFIAANLVLLPLGYLAIRAGGLLVQIPRRVLLPIILLFSVVGAFAINNEPFDIWVMLAMGLLGFVLDAFGIPLGPVVLGLILGDDVERYFIQSMIKSQGSFEPFLTRPIAGTLAVICLLLWLIPVLRTMFASKPASTGPV